MDIGTRRFRRADRMLTSREYRDVSRRGRRSSSRAFVVLWCAEGKDAAAGRPRLGLTASRKVGNAVARNRIKRRVREWFRGGARQGLSAGRLLVIARRPAGRLEPRALAAMLDRQVAEVLA